MIKVTIETTLNGKPSVDTFETSALLFTALSPEEITALPGDVRSGLFIDRTQQKNLKPVHYAALLAGAMRQAYLILPEEGAEKAIRLAGMLSEADHMLTRD